MSVEATLSGITQRLLADRKMFADVYCANPLMKALLSNQYFERGGGVWRNWLLSDVQAAERHRQYLAHQALEK